jgi:hypothetical protein
MKVKGVGAIFWRDFGGGIGRGQVAEGRRSSPVGSVSAGSVDGGVVFAGICGGVVLAVVVGVVRRR